MGEICRDLAVVQVTEGGETWTIFDDDHSWNDIARHFVRTDPVGAEELHRILGEMINDKS